MINETWGPEKLAYLRSPDGLVAKNHIPVKSGKFIKSKEEENGGGGMATGPNPAAAARLKMMMRGKRPEGIVGMKGKDFKLKKTSMKDLKKPGQREIAQAVLEF